MRCTTLGGPSVIEEGHDMMSIPVRPAFLMSPGLYGRCWRRWQPASGSHISGIAQGVSTQRVTLESQCVRCRCLSPGETAGLGEEHCKQQGHLLGLKGRGGREGSQGTAELARRVLCVWEMQGEKGGWQEKGHVGQARRRLGKRRVCTLLYKICFYISI